MAGDDLSKTMEESMAFRLECVHPNQNEGELCQYCGQVVPSTAKPEEQRNGHLQGVE